VKQSAITKFLEGINGLLPDSVAISISRCAVIHRFYVGETAEP
jgi:hypothetical protein